MTKVVQLPTRNDQAAGTAAKPGSVFDFTFYIGVVLTVVLPGVIFASYFGWLAAGILILCTLVAAGLGTGMYFNPPVTIHSCVPTVLSSDSKADITLKLAA